MIEAKFAVIYSFKIKDGMEAEFIENWESLTRLIYQYENSFGSRLHQLAENSFLGYAVWPDKETWTSSGKNLPPESSVYRTKMKNTCEEIKTQNELSIVSDLIADSQYSAD